MSLSINQFSQEWATVLSSYSNASGGAVQLISIPSLELPKARLSESEITDISRQIVGKKEELDSDILRKVGKSFETFKSHLENRNRTEFPNFLNSFAARFSRWANQHILLAHILNYVTFGIFNKLWNEGNQIYQNKQNLEERIKAFEGFSREIEQAIMSSQVAASKPEVQSKQENQKLIPEVVGEIIKQPKEEELKPLKASQEMEQPKMSSQVAESTPEVQLTQENQKLLPEIVGEILDFLDTEERKKISAWDFAKEAMEKSRGFQKMMNEMVEVFKCLNEIPGFEGKWEQIKKLKDFFNNEFPIPSYFTRESTRTSILNFISVILEIVNIRNLNDSSRKKLQTLFNVQELRKWLFLIYKNQTYPLAKHVGITINKRDFLEGCNSNWLRFAPLEIKNDKELVLALVSKDGSLLIAASEDLKNDKEVVLAAVTNNGRALEFASETLRNNKEVVLAALSQNEYAFKFASYELQNDNDIILAAIEKEPDISNQPEFNNNKKFVLATVSKKGENLKHASKTLRNNKEVVLAAVSQNGYALKFASYELQNDKDIILAAIEKAPYIFTQPEFNDNKKLVLASVSKEGEKLWHALDKLKNDKEVVLAAVSQDGSAFRFASDKLKGDKEVNRVALLTSWEGLVDAGLSAQDIQRCFIQS